LFKPVAEASIAHAFSGVRKDLHCKGSFYSRTSLFQVALGWPFSQAIFLSSSTRSFFRNRPLFRTMLLFSDFFFPTISIPLFLDAHLPSPPKFFVSFPGGPDPTPTLSPLSCLLHHTPPLLVLLSDLPRVAG